MPEIIHDFNDLNTLAQSWKRLEVNQQAPPQSYLWTQACVEALCDNAIPNMFVQRTGEVSIAIAPLIRQKSALATLELLGVGTLYEPMDFLYSDEVALEALLRKIQKSGAPLLLGRIPQDSPTVQIIDRLFRGHALISTQPADACPYIALDQRWLNPLALFTADRRSAFRRAEHKAAGLGNVSYEILCPTPNTLAAMLDEAWHVEAQSWKQQAGTALLVDTRRSDFYRKYAAGVCAQGQLRICFLRINGWPVAMQMAVETASSFWLLKIGFDETYAHLSPGNLLMLHTVQYAAAKGLASFEFLGTADGWTQLWAEQERACIQVKIYPYNASGLLSLASSAMQKMSSRAKERYAKAADLLEKTI